MGSDKKNVQSSIRNEQGRSNAQYGGLWNNYVGQNETARQNDVAERGNLTGKLNEMYDTRGMNPADQARIRALYGTGQGGTSAGASGGGGGGFSPTSDYSDTLAGYRGFASTGGVDMGKLEESLGTFRDLAGRTGGFDPTRLAGLDASIAGLRDIGKSGGFDASQIRGDYNKLRGIADTGGFDQNALNALRSGLGDYTRTSGIDPTRLGRIDADIANASEIARTGGFSDLDKSNIRRRGASQAAASYGQAKQELDRNRVLQGGYSPGFQAALAKTARGTSQGLTEANLKGEIDMANSIREGRLAGTQTAGSLGTSLADVMARNRLAGMQTTGQLEGQIAGNRIGAIQGAAAGQTALEDTLTRNRIAGLQGSADTDLATQGLINSTRQAAGTGIMNTHGQAQGLRQSGMLAGLGGMFNVQQGQNALAAQQAAASAAGAAQSAAQDRWEREFAAENERYMMGQGMGAQQFGLSGLGQLYGMGSGQQGQANQFGLNIANSQSGANQGLIGQQTQAAQLPSWWQQGLQGLGAGASMAGAFTGNPAALAGIPGMPNPSPASSPYQSALGRW